MIYVCQKTLFWIKCMYIFTTYKHICNFLQQSVAKNFLLLIHIIYTIVLQKCKKKVFALLTRILSKPTHEFGMHLIFLTIKETSITHFLFPASENNGIIPSFVICQRSWIRKNQTTLKEYAGILFVAFAIDNTASSNTRSLLTTPTWVHQFWTSATTIRTTVAQGQTADSFIAPQPKRRNTRGLENSRCICRLMRSVSSNWLSNLPFAKILWLVNAGM